MSDYHLVVFDIGKTNKKLYVYDNNLQCQNPDEKGTSFPPISWTTSTGNKYECDDMASIYRWMLEGLREATEKYSDIKVISISTHGATIAHLGETENRIFEGDGGLVFPIISYENEIPASIDDAFYDEVGLAPAEAQRQTATPRLGWLLNCAKQIFLLQNEVPEQYVNVTDVLMFPQYLGYLLTGQKRIEPTYTGCHGYLLDASGTRYSTIADSLNITDKLPDLPFSNPWDPLGGLKPEIAKITGLPENCKVTVGVHDSNAALVPYLSRGLEDFVVQDSGTWVVTMAPKIGGDAEFETHELGREVFYNRSIYGDPVKTNIFRGGAEFDFYRSNVLDNKQRPDVVDEELLAEIISQKSAFCLPTIERGSGLFPNSVARLEGVETIFRDHSTAWHVVDLSLAIQGYQALRMAAGENPKHVYIEGNIGKHNPVYRGIIASLFPESEMFYGSMGGAPFGAAILGIAAAENVKPEDVAPRFEISLNRIDRFNKLTDSVQKYAAAFLEKVK